MHRIKIGCRLKYYAVAPTPSVFIIQPPAAQQQMLMNESLDAGQARPLGEYTDAFGNRCLRLVLPAGDTVIQYDALAIVPPDGDRVRPHARQVPLQELPDGILRFTLPSRYAETDKLLGFAWQTFGRVPEGWARAQAVCDWVHHNIAYKQGSSRPDWSAVDVLAKREGVCRDRAHLVVALCRALNMPARYAVSYYPDVGMPDDGVPPDFHAYAEVFLEGGWSTFDPHTTRASKGRIHLAAGLDAADAAFATLYGSVFLNGFAVWADEIDAEGRKIVVPKPTAPAPMGVVAAPTGPAPLPPPAERPVEHPPRLSVAQVA
jgi:transglutaminase-like putative cysteine protease